jgi:hypothetical protein
MVVGFTATYAISVYHYHSCESESRSWQGVLDIALCDKVSQLLAAGRWFSPITPVSSTNKTQCHNIAECGIKLQKSEPKLHLCTLELLTANELQFKHQLNSDIR